MMISCTSYKSTSNLHWATIATAQILFEEVKNLSCDHSARGPWKAVSLGLPLPLIYLRLSTASESALTNRSWLSLIPEVPAKANDPRSKPFPHSHRRVTGLPSHEESVGRGCMRVSIGSSGPANICVAYNRLWLPFTLSIFAFFSFREYTWLVDYGRGQWSNNEGWALFFKASFRSVKTGIIKVTP